MIHKKNKPVPFSFTNVVDFFFRGKTFLKWLISFWHLLRNICLTCLMMRITGVFVNYSFADSLLSMIYEDMGISQGVKFLITHVILITEQLWETLFKEGFEISYMRQQMQLKQWKENWLYSNLLLPKWIQGHINPALSEMGLSFW